MVKKMRVRGNDRGSALVAAVGVSVIGMALATVVITQAIVVTRDAGRDQVRTSEVHAAEAALDVTMLELETATPCTPSMDGAEMGSGAQTVLLDVSIAYQDESGAAVDCSTGTPSATPYFATIRAEASAKQPVIGVDPVRIFEARIALEPRSANSVGAAIFSEGDLDTGAGFTLFPSSAGDLGDVWVDTGDWDCSTNVVLEGSLYVVDGGVNFQNSGCEVRGDVWSEESVEIRRPSSVSTNAIDGDLTVRTGDVIPIHNSIGIGGNVLIGGTENGGGSLAVGGTYEEGVTGIPDLEPVGLPDIDWDPTEWTAAPYNFTARSLAQWQADIGTSDPCTVGKKTSGSSPIDLPPSGVSSGVMYDLRTCNLVTTKNFSLNIDQDVALFVESFHSVNGITVTSADGQPHTIYIIVPTGDHVSTPAGFSPGDIDFAQHASIASPIEVFFYTPGELTFKNGTVTNGQMYAGAVDLDAKANFYYTPTTIPGVDLSISQLTQGSVVELTYKREVN